MRFLDGHHPVRPDDVFIVRTDPGSRRASTSVCPPPTAPGTTIPVVVANT